MIRALVFAFGVTLSAVALRGADTTRPVVGPGATKEEVINAYGWPTGQSKLGDKEVLNYPQGSITLSGGKVEKMDFSPNVQWAPPKPKPPPPSPTSVKRVEQPTDFWLTDAAEAMRQAQVQHGRVLALFTGSDWSPPSKKFQDEVALHPDFVNAFIGDFVFLKLDFPTRTQQPAALKKQNEELRARCGVTTYPALIVLSSRGAPVGVVDLAKERDGDSYRAKVIAAVTEVRDLLKQQPVPVEEAKADAQPGATASDQPKRPETDHGPGAALMWSAEKALSIGLGAGALLAIILVAWLWRSRGRGADASIPERPKFAGPAVRLSDVPSPEELGAWPAERVRDLTAGLFEATGYKANVRPSGGDYDLELLRPGHTTPSVLVSCQAGSAGATNVKVVRELFGTLVSTGVASAWIVAPGGFSDDARQLAGERGIELIDSAGLISRLHALDPLVLTRVLGRVGA